jgi:hypothetical protein
LKGLQEACTNPNGQAITIKSASGLYPATFIDFTSNLKSVLHELYNQHVEPKLAMIELRKHGVY